MDDLITMARFSELVGLIYDCAIDPARWPIAMEAIRIELNFHNAVLDLMLLPSGKSLTSVICNVPPEYEALIPASGADVIEQWGGAELVQSLPMDRPAVMTHVNPAFDFETTTNYYYNAFAKPQCIIDALAVGLARDSRAIGTVTFGRHMSAGPIGDREVTIAHLLVLHLQRAATMNRMLEGAKIAHAGFVETLDTVTAPIIMLGADLTILHANSAATQLLARETLIRSVGGRLDVTTPAASRELVTAMAQAARDESPISRRGLGIPVVGGDRHVGALHLLPLRRARAGYQEGVVAALFVADADVPFVAPTEMVATLFDLTPAEARVFDHVVKGYTQAAVATALGVERSTIKTHLARLYDKIGVRRQADLVRIAASLAVPVAG